MVKSPGQPRKGGFRFQELVIREEEDDHKSNRHKERNDNNAMEKEEEDGGALSARVVHSPEPEQGIVGLWMETLRMAVPLAISRLSWVVMKTTDTALIGHTGTRNLSAAAIADLYTQSTGVLINGWILSTLVSQAFGSSNKKMGGIWLQVSLVVLLCLSVPVAVSWLLCGPVLQLMDVSGDLIRPAAYYAAILAIAIPPRIGVGQLSQYFISQNISKPLIKTGLLSMTVNLLLGMVLVLGIGVLGWDGFGFWMCPVVTVAVEWATLLLYLLEFCYRQQLHKLQGCWPDDGFQWSHITSARVKEYINLYYPAALASASDWWRVSAIGVVAVTFNDHASLAVFNSSYRIAWMSLIFTGSVGSAMGVLLGQQLGKGDVAMSKFTTMSCLTLALGIVVVLAAVFFTIPDKVAMIFSSDDEVIELYEEVALPLTFMLITMNLSVVLERVPYSCGRTQVVLWTGLFGSWVAQVPAVLLCTHYYRNDLFGLFLGVSIGYCALDFLLLGVIYTTDWAYYADEASRRSEAIKPVSELEITAGDDEETGLQSSLKSTGAVIESSETTNPITSFSFSDETIDEGESSLW